MILGIDHIALAVKNSEEAKLNLVKKGYDCVFSEVNLPNAITKKRFLKHFQSTHDIALFKKVGAVSIEITNHGYLDNIIAPYSINENSIEVASNDINEEKNFWKTVLKFKETEDENKLKLPSMVPAWSCTVSFKQINVYSLATLDSSGYSCLAFLTNSLYEDIKLAEKHGAWDIISPFNFNVNKKNLDIVMFRTPTGAICELIELGKNEKK